jgi:hypothetical protein
MGQVPEATDKSWQGTRRMAKRRKRSRRIKHPWSGFAAAAGLWLFGVMFFVGPAYLGLDGTIRVVLFAIGTVWLALSMTFAAIELSDLLDNEGLKSWGVSLLFWIPALFLHLFVTHFSLNTILDAILRVLVLLFGQVSKDL